MSGYQFFHVETYARKPSKTGKKQGIIGLVREAERLQNACLHIENPQKATLLFGKLPSEVAVEIVSIAENAKDSKGRKLRVDAQVLLAGVASYPIPSRQTSFDCPKFQKWLKLNLAFLNNEYGRALKSIVLHLDESYPHIHFYCHPELDKENRLNIREIHCGMKLRDSVPDQGVGSGKLRSRLYKQAMRDQQDRYYQQVGVKCGLARIGPKTRKLTRREWVYEQQNAKRRQELHELEKINQQMLNDIEKKKLSILELTRRNKQVLKLIEQENIDKACMQESLFSKSKNKLSYLKAKLDKSIAHEKRLTIEISYEKQKNRALEQSKAAMRTKLSKQDREIESLKTKVSNLTFKIDGLKKAISSWKQKYFKLITSIKEKGVLTRNLANNYERSYDA